VRLDGTTWANSPARHEAGTPNVVGAVALAAACRFIAELPYGALVAHEAALLDRLTDGLEAIVGVRLLRLWPQNDPGVLARIGRHLHHRRHPGQLVAQYLSAEHGIGVRDGRFCAHPLLGRLAGSATAVRASIGLGSGAADVDRLISAVVNLGRRGPGWTYADAAGDYLPLPDPRGFPAGLTNPCITRNSVAS
jgi:selenocysteine lyase/cysteine desulfurase